MRTIQSCKLFLAVSLALLAFVRVSGQGQAVAYVPADENLEARERFRDSKFGIFIHFGLYSMLGQGEWVMNNRNIDRRDYAALAAAFYPSRFDAAAWVSAIKAAGARYVCVTSRHHDGFSMFASDMTSYDIVDATPFKRDLIGELAAECHRQGIGLHLYYSHLDWMRSDYPQGKTGHGTGREPGDGDWESYYRFMNGQLTELLTRYGDVGPFGLTACGIILKGLTGGLRSSMPSSTPYSLLAWSATITTWHLSRARIFSSSSGICRVRTRPASRGRKFPPCRLRRVRR